MRKLILFAALCLSLSDAAVTFPKAERETSVSILKALKAIETKKPSLKEKRNFKVEPRMTTLPKDRPIEEVWNEVSPVVFDTVSPTVIFVRPEGVDRYECGIYPSLTPEGSKLLQEEQKMYILPRIVFENFDTGALTELLAPEKNGPVLTERLVSTVEKTLQGHGTLLESLQGVIVEWKGVPYTELGLQTGLERLLTELKAMLQRQQDQGNNRKAFSLEVWMEIPADYMEIGTKEVKWLSKVTDKLIIAGEESVESMRNYWQAPINWLSGVLAELKVEQADPGQFVVNVDFRGVFKTFGDEKLVPMKKSEYLSILKREPEFIWHAAEGEHEVKSYLPGKGEVIAYYPSRASILHKLHLLQRYGCGINVLNIHEGLPLFLYQF